MSLDLGALTGSVVVGLPGVQACLLVSRDGLPLSAFPLGEERRVMEVWLRLAELGDAERGFVVIGGQMWAFSVRGFYGTVAVAAPSVRPGLLLDRLDRVLARLAEESATEPDHRPPAPAVERPSAAERPPTPPRAPRPEGAPSETDPRVHEEARPARPAPAPPSHSEPAPAETRRGSDEEEEDTQPGAKVASVDAIALAREFAGLITEEEAR